jgi:glutathione S-transferase
VSVEKEENAMKLYGFKGTRSNRVEWMLQELGLAYDFVKVDLTTGAHKQPDHVGRHAHALVPAFEDGDVRMIESVATCLYLADAHPERRLAPATTSPERARYYQLAVYAVSTLDEVIVPIFFNTVVYQPDQRQRSVVEAKMPIWETAAALLTKELGDAPFFLGKSFSAVDVIVGYDLGLAAKAGLLKSHPILAAYVERVMSRDAFKKAYAA